MNSGLNRLSSEKSPYLRQHAGNPVHWYPWGEEAFERARTEDRPVFLSIGYATCHWCHVMERESFEDEEIAGLLNAAFICIKVDREERPDIDHIYMTACQIMTGAGGWPLSIFMTPERKPFYAATYIPPEGRYGRIGLTELIPRLESAWHERRDEVLDAAARMTDALAQQAEPGTQQPPGSGVTAAGYAELMRLYDRDCGGFGHAPKFPTPHRLLFLLRQGDAQGVAAAEHSLEAMYRGGLFDQIGWGFHRYSTDAEWLVPHFEKMLYDQAMLTLVYCEAHALTGKAIYAEAVHRILTYVGRDMTSPEGGFYSAEDADSEGEEGRFYLWSVAELRAVLGDAHPEVFRLWNIRPEGNFRNESTGRIDGRNIPHLSRLPDAAEAARLEEARRRLQEVRRQRVHPLKDAKILADWNGLMIAAFARAGRILGDPERIEIAVAANAFIETAMRRPDGSLWHRWCEGDIAVEGLLDDYAFVIFGLLELYEATLELRWMETALHYDQILAQQFADPEGGGYFMTAATAEKLPVRPKELYDGAVPAGNSVQLFNLLRLARLTGQPDVLQRAADAAGAFGEAVGRSPSACAMALTALQFASSGGMDIVVVGPRDAADTQAMLDRINRTNDPGRVLLLKDPAEADRLEALAPYTAPMKMINGKATAYICRNGACEPAVTSPDELRIRTES